MAPHALSLALVLLLPQRCSGIQAHFQEEAECRDAADGEQCHRAVSWLLAGGLDKHPDWYPELSAVSTFQQVQAALHQQGKSNCTKPCLVEDHQGCRDAVEGDECFRALTWIKSGGLQKHPDWYPQLTPESSTEDIQAELHRRGKGGCFKPCPAAAPGCDKEGLCNTQVPPQVMSVEQLNRFLSGQWDGYVMATKAQAQAWEVLLRDKAPAATTKAKPAAPASALAKLPKQLKNANLAAVKAAASEEPLPELDQDAQLKNANLAAAASEEALPAVDQDAQLEGATPAK